MKILVVAGARPNFMKIAPVMWAAERRGIRPVLVHTGQHYDDGMSAAFFRDLAIPEPDHNLACGGGSHAVQTARVMERFEPVLLEERPDWVVVVGDVNSTLACALVTSKLRHAWGCQIAHVEAGLRSHDWRMPEEVNRVLTDRLSDLLLTPSRDAHPNLAAEGIPAERVHFVGNVMIDSLMRAAGEAVAGNGAHAPELPDEYIVLTLHRPATVDDAEELRRTMDGVARVADLMPVIFPVHPRTRARLDALGFEPGENIRLLDPLGYREMVQTVRGAATVLTDSGGLQEETTALGVPCVTLRENTERPITVTGGTNRMIEWPITADGLLAATREALDRRGSALSRPEGWDGAAGERIVDALLDHHST